MGSGPRRILRTLLALTLVAGVFSLGWLVSRPAPAHAAVNQQINFQGRLLNAQGAIVPDGYYNIQFRIYQDGDGQAVGNTTGSPAGSLKWTESYLNANGQGLLVRNGFLSVQLGSVTAFGSSVDWNEPTLWLSMNIAGTGASCTPFTTCTPDGEMVPMKRLSANAYALNAGMLGGLTSAGFIQNTTSPQTASFNVTGSGAVGGTLSAGGLLTASAGLTASGAAINLNAGSNFAVNIATGSSTGAISIGGGSSTFSLNSTALDISTTGVITGATGITSTGTITGGTVNATSGFQVNGTALASTNLSDTANLGRLNTAQIFTNNNVFKPGTNSTTAFQVQNSGTTTPVFNVDTSNNRIGVGTATPGYTFDSTGDINTSTGYWVGGSAGASTTCSGGTFLQNAVVSGGITTGGICAAASNGVTTVDTFSGTSIANGASISGTVISFGPADGTNPGMVSTGAQTLAGAKSFSGLVTAGAGLTAGGAAINLNAGSNFATNINTGTSNTLVSIGGGSGTFALNTTNIDISSAGAVTGATGIAMTSGNFAQSGTGTFSTGTGTVTLNGATSISNANSFTVGTGASSMGGTLGVTGLATFSGGITATNGGNVSFQRGSDFTATGITNNANLGTGALVRLNGISSQTLTGIAGGIDGRVLSIVNAGSTSAVITNNDGASSAGNRIITGTGGNLALPAGSGISLIYDSGASVWRVTGAVAATGGSGVNTVGSFSASSIANGASISGTVISFGPADGTNPGMVSTGYQSFAGAKSFAGLVTASAGLTAGGATINLNDTSSFATNINTGSSTGLVSIGGGNGTFALNTTNIDISSAGALSGVTGLDMASGNFAQAGNGTFSTGTGAVNLNGDVTVASGRTLTVNGSALFKPATNSTTAFQVQPSGSATPVFNVDTSNGRIGVGSAAPGYALDVIGDINTSTQFRVAGTVICASGGCIPAAGSGNYIQNGTSPQTANFNISGSGIIAGNLTVNGNAVLFKPTTNATTAFQIQPSGSTTPVFNVDTTNGRVGIGMNNPTYRLDIAAGGAAQQGLRVTTANQDTWGLMLNNATRGTTNATGFGIFQTDAGNTQFYNNNQQALVIDTSGRLGVFGTTPGYALDVGGDVNTSTQYRIGGTVICTSAGCTPAAGSANYIQNGTATQASSNFNISGSGTAGTSLLAPLFDTASAVALNIGGAATAINLNDSTTLAANMSLTMASGSGTFSQTYTATSGNAASIAVNNASGTVGAALNITSSGAGTVTSGISVNNTAGTMGSGLTLAGTMTNGVNFTGTTTYDLNRSTGNLTANGAGGMVISTNGVVRGAFDTSNNMTLGNGGTTGTAAAPNNFVVRGTGSTTTGVAGGTLSLQGGNATVGNANGGNLNLSGGTGFGTGTNGLVIITTPTFSTTTNDANCYTGGALVAASCTITATSVNGSSAIIVGFNQINQIATLPDPSNTTAGRIVYITAANTSSDFTLRVNGGGQGNDIAMRQNTTATMIWNGADWTAAGASSSTTLQSAYDNTLQSAGGAELVVSKTSATNGLTIRDSSTAPVNGTLVSVQTASAATLFSVKSGVTEYARNAGAETAGSSATTFPASTWTTAATAAVTRNITTSNIATGQGSVQVVTTNAANDGVENVLTGALNANSRYNVSFAARLAGGTFTNMNVHYSINGTAQSVACVTGQAIATSVWTKVNCTFTAPSSGITATNAILITQASGAIRTFYIDNLSVTIAADFNYATDGNVNVPGFASWAYFGAGGTAARNTADGYEASDSATATITNGSTSGNAGLRNTLAVAPLTSTLYRITVYGRLNSGAAFNDFKVQYSRNGTATVDCTDYNTTALTAAWAKITCYVTTDGTAPAATTYVNFLQTGAAVRTFSVDAFSMTLASDSVPNVQVGGGTLGGPTTLFTLDKGASAPIASNNDALLGSMYYDTTLGKLQCYEADGWGACGSSPDSVVTISPEYTNAVMHGTGIGTMTSDICSDTLNINDATNGPLICGTNETYNFYKWTSPQPSAQTYGIYVTYQLPSTFKEFASGQTSLIGRTDSANSSVNYQIYRSDDSGLTACGSAVTVSTGMQTSWQTVTATGSADPSTCGFGPGDSIVFRINATASGTANAYISNLNFTFSNK